MLPYYCIYVLAIAGVGVSLLPDEQWRGAIQKLYITFLLLVLLGFATLRHSGIDRDYLNYVSWFQFIARERLAVADWLKDPAFVLISSVAASLGCGYIAVLFAFTAAALACKLWFAKATCNGNWLLLFLYLMVCRFFLPQEMTQIRAAVAVPLMSVAIVLAFRGRTRTAWSIYLTAVMFHVSVLLVLPILVLILYGVRFRSRWWIIALLPAAALALVLLRDALLLTASLGRMSPYLAGDVETGTVNFLSVFFLARISVLSALVVSVWHRLSDEEQLIIFCSAIGICCQVVLWTNDNLALRSSDLFGLFDLLLLLIPFKYMSNKYLRLAYLQGILALGVALFASTLRILQPYVSIFG